MACNRLLERAPRPCVPNMDCPRLSHVPCSPSQASSSTPARLRYATRQPLSDQQVCLKPQGAYKFICDDARLHSASASQGKHHRPKRYSAEGRDRSSSGQRETHSSGLPAAESGWMHSECIQPFGKLGAARPERDQRSPNFQAPASPLAQGAGTPSDRHKRVICMACARFCLVSRVDGCGGRGRCGRDRCSWTTPRENQETSDVWFYLRSVVEMRLHRRLGLRVVVVVLDVVPFVGQPVPHRPQAPSTPSRPVPRLLLPLLFFFLP